jgi:hypothetical protein
MCLRPAFLFTVLSLDAIPVITTSHAWRLMRDPAGEYRQRVAQSTTGRWTRALATPVLLTLLLGVVTSVAGAGRVTITLVLSGALCWSFVVVLQLMTGVALIRSAPSKRVDLARGVELLFDGHGPWSLWLVGIGVLLSIFPSQNIMVGSALVAFAWTARILRRFGEDVLGLSPAASLARVLAHQAATAVLIVLYVELTTRLSLRIVAMFQR